MLCAMSFDLPAPIRISRSSRFSGLVVFDVAFISEDTVSMRRLSACGWRMRNAWVPVVGEWILAMDVRPPQTTRVR